MSRLYWDEQKATKAVNVLKRSSTIEQALTRMSAQFKKDITYDALSKGLRANGLQGASFYLKGAPMEPLEEKIHEEMPPNGIRRQKGQKKVVLDEEDYDVILLMDALRKKAHTLRSLCDKVFHKSPQYVESIVNRAKNKGFLVSLEGDHVHFQAPEAPKKLVQIPLLKKTKDVIVGVFSDVHVGSDYHLKDAWIDHIKKTYQEGARLFLCPGDLLEGCYRHAQYEVQSQHWERQAREAIRSMPEFPDAQYHFIDGNHDFTFTEKIGVESGLQLQRLARSMGRKDIHFHGSRGAMLKYGSIRIELWHPKKGSGYALSYQLQNHIRDTEPQDRPHILLSGHWHQFCQFQQGGVYAVSCGTFQHGKGPFGKSLGGTTAIGGVVLRYSVLEDGSLGLFSATHRAYSYKEPDIVIE